MNASVVETPSSTRNARSDVTRSCARPRQQARVQRRLAAVELDSPDTVSHGEIKGPEVGIVLHETRPIPLVFVVLDVLFINTKRAVPRAPLGQEDNEFVSPHRQQTSLSSSATLASLEPTPILSRPTLCGDIRRNPAPNDRLFRSPRGNFATLFGNSFAANSQNTNDNQGASNHLKTVAKLRRLIESLALTAPSVHRRVRRRSGPQVWPRRSV